MEIVIVPCYLPNALTVPQPDDDRFDAFAQALRDSIDTFPRIDRDTLHALILMGIRSIEENNRMRQEVYDLCDRNDELLTHLFE